MVDDKIKREAKNKADEKKQEVKQSAAAHLNAAVQTVTSSRVLLALGGIGVVAWVLTGNEIVLSDETKVLLAAAVGVGAALSPIAVWLMSRVLNLPKAFVVDVDAADLDTPDVWVTSTERAEEDLDVTEGEIEKREAYDNKVWTGRQFNREKETISGTWRGKATDTELMNAIQEIKRTGGV